MRSVVETRLDGAVREDCPAAPAGEPVAPAFRALLPGNLLSPRTGVMSISHMLIIGGQPVPRNDLTYLAFRVAFQETLERIVLSHQLQDGSEIFGFLTEVPFLRGVAPHVQLDLLAETWQRHRSRRRMPGSLVDESVIYAVCETAARIAEDEPAVITHCLLTGPKNSRVHVDGFLPGELRNLHLTLATDGDFLLLSQLEDMPPEQAAETRQQFQLDAARIEEMFEVLGRWSISPDLGSRLDGLTTEREIIRTRTVIEEVLQRSVRE